MGIGRRLSRHRPAAVQALRMTAASLTAFGLASGFEQDAQHQDGQVVHGGPRCGRTRDAGYREQLGLVVAHGWAAIVPVDDVQVRIAVVVQVRGDGAPGPARPRDLPSDRTLAITVRAAEVQAIAEGQT